MMMHVSTEQKKYTFNVNAILQIKICHQHGEDILSYK